MKRSVFVLLSAVLLLSVSSIAFAAGPDPLVFETDCEGWSVSGYMHLDGGELMEVDVTVELFEGEELVYTVNILDVIYAADDKNFLYEGRFGMEICGDYKAVMTMWVVGIYGPGVYKREKMITCECLPKACTYTPGYWKNHPDAWPVLHLTVGCEEYTQRELIRIFDWPTRGDMTIKMFHHLVAAKLNVLIGAEDYIMGAITAGDDYLCTYGLGSKPKEPLKTEAEDIKNELADYNEIPCFCDTPDVMFSIEGPATVEKAAAATEETSWGSIKKKHQ